ncbi:putative multicopper oxidase [Halovivax ruber XH-70]|uniref:Multicopper oxidase CueO n=1 Tax=Halovivax ruber (strain DSM 18193 / JCM 13892 / XH-70) TaxID=797302 RepID=L0IEK8_HALRX|nr:multicopper oxidase domain-containing protein [Halovivax ruber]AGB17204.1 putative multicopper oxidase [Halovivax ruber XH-70]
MRPVSRRRLLQLGGATGLAGLASAGVVGRSNSDDRLQDHEGPELEKYVQPLPILDERDPDDWVGIGQYHNLEITEFTQQLHPDLPETTLWGFDGQFPGPIIPGFRGLQLAVEVDNSGLPDEHLLSVDERIAGTTTANYPGHDGPVPEVRNSIHFHGLAVQAASDGQADMWVSPDGVTGPRRSRDVQVIPNQQPRLSTTYHDHTRAISRLNNYAGVIGPYLVRDGSERQLGLPTGEYDVTLVLADRSVTDDGALYYPDEFVPMFGGEKATVNGAIWPYMEVEPRRYRFRILNPSNGRTWGLRLRNEADDSEEVPEMTQLSAGHGYLDEVVGVGPYGDLGTLLLSPFERAEVVIDFADFPGETFTVTNHALFPYPHGDHHNPNTSSPAPDLDEVMQFRVSRDRVDDPSRDPHEIEFPTPERPDPADAVETREITMQMDMNEAPMFHTLNDRGPFDDVAIRPQLGSTETWELKNDTMQSHPIHLHLVRFWVEGRKDLGADEFEDPRPNERSGKDTVMVMPNQNVKLTVAFDDHAGTYPFHCHNLEHEDNAMMRPLEVVGEDSDE